MLTPVASVSDFVLQIRRALEANIPLCWVGGEISNLTRAASGHLYFTLKDARAQIRCTMWRNRVQLLPFQLREGMQVEVRANISIYEARGDLQLAVDSIRRAGMGNLYEIFLRLKAQLETEGLFASARKRPLPALPAGIGIITSPAAAALQDVLSTLARRAPALPVVLYPSPVQGEGAAAQLASAIATANARATQDGVQVLLLCRGGGSMEDLWAFNEEVLVRAVAASALPIISGVGHETDTTLADFAADLRAPTPTAAAEILSAGWFEQRSRLPRLLERLQRALQHRLGNADQRLLHLQQRLIHPRTRLARSAERLKLLSLRLENSQRMRLQRQQTRLQNLRHRLDKSQPDLAQRQACLKGLERALTQTMRRRLEKLQGRTHLAGNSLELLNPHAILQRGYAIVRDEAGRIVRQAASLPHQARIEIQLADSSLQARVEKSKKD
ncbi:exodeoxyribonuclease VII large subunit [Uliginosibacterium gangwonense]|uniref:exodeoxyribonuclease VII large subunit n=1 Tax=Uliginosibacterium gangwonense TaxID=392736 RepID=UPI00036CB81C